MTRPRAPGSRRLGMAANLACAAPRANSSLLGGEVAELSTPTLVLLRKQEPGPPHSASTRSSNRPKASVEAYSATARSRGLVEAHLRMSDRKSTRLTASH